MVVVSDDVHEYAVALKDTEEKIARCPANVSHKSRLVPVLIVIGKKYNIDIIILILKYNMRFTV